MKILLILTSLLGFAETVIQRKWDFFCVNSFSPLRGPSCWFEYFRGLHYEFSSCLSYFGRIINSKNPKADAFLSFVDFFDFHIHQSMCCFTLIAYIFAGMYFRNFVKLVKFAKISFQFLLANFHWKTSSLAYLWSFPAYSTRFF